uniref:Uncharacterized protein n=1 Tax=Arundo donax TaxID=35708 RepID=A0A0A9DIC2_ARUDO
MQIDLLWSGFIQKLLGKRKILMNRGLVHSALMNRGTLSPQFGSFGTDEQGGEVLRRQNSRALTKMWRTNSTMEMNRIQLKRNIHCITCRRKLLLVNHLRKKAPSLEIFFPVSHSPLFQRAGFRA